MSAYPDYNDHGYTRPEIDDELAASGDEYRDRRKDSE